MTTFGVTGASGQLGAGRISAATRQDYAAAATSALLDDEPGNRTYELGGPAFDLVELARVITEVTGTPVPYGDLPVEEYMSSLRRAGLDEATAHFVAALDASIALGDLETETDDLAHLLGRPVRPLSASVRMAYDRLTPYPGALTLPSSTPPTAGPAAGGLITAKEKSTHDYHDHQPDRSSARAHEEGR